VVLIFPFLIQLHLLKLYSGPLQLATEDRLEETRRFQKLLLTTRRSISVPRLIATMKVTSKTGASMFGDGSQENDAIAPADTGPMSTSEAPSTGASPSRLKRKATAIHLETITIDLMYDLTLTIGEPDHSTGGIAFQVNKGSIRNVSPVWSKMLGGGWKESNMSNISFPEDNCKAFLIVLQIAHFQFYQLPEKLSISELVDLAILTDKYELYNAIGIALEIKKWMEPYHRPGAMWPANTMLQEFIIITSGLQMQKNAQYLSSRLAMEVQVNEAGDYYLEDDKRNKVPLRSDMLPSITRKQLLDTSLSRHAWV
jgi:hypothetical protein